MRNGGPHVNVPTDPRNAHSFGPCACVVSGYVCVCVLVCARLDQVVGVHPCQSFVLRVFCSFFLFGVERGGDGL